MQVIDPDDWWFPFGEAGRIEEATISLEPKGIYTEVGMYLTISDAGMFWPSGMDLEIVLDFNLPAGSIIHDSWLWMPDGEIIVKADVYDISNAIETYEDIVDRNRDPSILYKKEISNYQIRIYPLTSGESRKIKISYLCPAEWTNEEVSTWIPTEIFTTSNFPLEHAKIITIDNEKWLNPRLEGASDINFSASVDPVFGAIQVAMLSEVDFNKPIKFVVDAPFDDKNYFISKLESNGENFYQLAYLPPNVSPISTPRNYLFAINYESSNSLTTFNQMQNSLFAEIKEKLGPADRFNIAIGDGGQTAFIAEEWLAATSENFDQYLVPLQAVNSWSTGQLLSNSIDFALDKELSTDIVVLSNSNDVDLWNYDNLADDLIDKIQGKAITFHAIDFQALNFEINDWNWGEQLEYDSGNYQLYKLLCNGTQGRLYSIFQGDLNLWDMLDQAMVGLTRESYSFDLHTKMNQGFTYGRHNIGSLQSAGVDQPFLQIGKYTGDFPMEIEFSAFDNNDFVYEEEWINASNVAEEDTLTREMWMGNQINFLEGALNSNSEIAAIVDMSIGERVLSKYTAFLALDLENGGEPCANCWEVGNTIVISVDDPLESDYVISAAPNPFSEFTTISIDFGSTSIGDLKSISIFDAFGKRVAFVTDGYARNAEGQWQWIWNGANSNGQKLPAGVYYFVLETDQNPITQKLVILK